MARQELRLVKERRLADLIAPPKGSGVMEASGVVSKGGDFYVVFDNVRHVARIDPGLSPTSKRHEWFGRRCPGDGYEDIAYSPARKRFYLLIEAEKHADGSYKPAEDLRRMYTALQVTPDREAVTYCQGGYRAAHTYLALRLLGFTRVRNYTGSWKEWGDREDLPIDRAPGR